LARAAAVYAAARAFFSAGVSGAFAGVLRGFLAAGAAFGAIVIEFCDVSQLQSI